MKPKASRTKEIIKLKMQINKMKNQKGLEDKIKPKADS